MTGGAILWYAGAMSSVLQVVPAGVLSVAYDVLADGQPKGRIEHGMLSMRGQALISTPDRTFTARRQKVLRSACVMETADGDTRASAEKESFWREHYRVRFGETTLFLRQKLMSRWGLFQIFDGSGEIGGIRFERMLSRRMLVEYTTASPPPLEITEFLVWIVLMVHRRQASEASG